MTDNNLSLFRLVSDQRAVLVEYFVIFVFMMAETENERKMSRKQELFNIYIVEFNKSDKILEIDINFLIKNNL